MNVDWETPNGGGSQWEHVVVEVLMDIRNELRGINRKLNALECPNFVAIPHTLRAIQKNTTKKRKQVKPKLRAVA